MKSPWKKLSSKIVHKNPWYRVRRDAVITPIGKRGEYFVLEKGNAVFIVALDERRRVLLIQNYRYPTDMPSLEFPAGAIEKEQSLMAAKRELEEETGYQAKKWKRVGKIQSFNGISNEMSYIYLATDLFPLEENKQREEGIAGIQFVSLTEALKLIEKGKITDSQSIAALTLAALKLKIVS